MVGGRATLSELYHIIMMLFCSIISKVTITQPAHTLRSWLNFLGSNLVKTIPEVKEMSHFEFQ